MVVIILNKVLYFIIIIIIDIKGPKNRTFQFHFFSSFISAKIFIFLLLPASSPFSSERHHHLLLCFHPSPPTTSPSPSLSLIINTISIVHHLPLVITVAVLMCMLLLTFLLQSPLLPLLPPPELSFTTIIRLDHQLHFISCASIDITIYSLALAVAAA